MGEAESSRSKLRSLLAVPDWWIWTAMELGPERRRRTSAAERKKEDSSGPVTGARAWVEEEMGPSGRLLREISRPLRKTRAASSRRRRRRSEEKLEALGRLNEWRNHVVMRVGSGVRRVA